MQHEQESSGRTGVLSVGVSVHGTYQMDKTYRIKVNCFLFDYIRNSFERFFAWLFFVFF